MTPQFLNYVRHLSNQDKKTLSQKALKTAEEVGELAKVVLPYDNAYATTHRFVEREAILEEAVDTALCALSVAYDLDFSDEQIDSMFSRKVEKWAKLQANEIGLKYPLPFEIHITVPAPALHTAEYVNQFKSVCATIGVKPIVLDLTNAAGELVVLDFMTSSKHFGDNRSAYLAATDIKNQLIDCGYPVIRVKIETVPWHPAAPQHPGDIMPANCYFEAHIPVTIDLNLHQSYLRSCVSKLAHSVHTSNNAFKVLPTGHKVIMLTHRAYDGIASQFTANVQQLTTQLTELGNCFEVGKVHVEFSVYDTKISHDIAWINAT